MSQAADHPIVLPPAYFPPVSWMALYLTSQDPVIDVHSWYEKQQLSSRTWIRGSDGAVCLTIPVERRNTRAPLLEKKVSYQENWPEVHYRSLDNYYRNSPYFEICEEEVKRFFRKRPAYLIEWIEGGLKLVNQLLGESWQWELSKQFLPPGEVEADYRKEFSGKGMRKPSGIHPAPYQQVFDPFIPDLSVLDLLFNRGRETILITQSGITDTR